MVAAAEEHGLRLHGPGRALQAGVCHRIVVEEYARPGDIVVLTDSHTPTAGVMNAFAFGVGSTAMTFALRTGLIPVTVPKVVDPKMELSSNMVISHVSCFVNGYFLPKIKDVIHTGSIVSLHESVCTLCLPHCIVQ